MTSKIDDSIKQLAIDITCLRHLDMNARRGNVESIMASYSKFGQLKPIVAVKGSDPGTFTVIAGNHQLEAATRLGWDKIAVSVVDLNNDDAIAFALADNRTSDLASTDTEILMSIINSLDSRDSDLFDALMWDEFAIAAIEQSTIPRSLDIFDNNSGWSPPEIVMNTVGPTPSFNQPQTRDNEPFTEAQARSAGSSIESLVTQGSTASGSSGVSNALIQYTLVFDNATQQSAWYSFIRWLKDHSGIQGNTTAERLVEFIKRTVKD